MKVAILSRQEGSSFDLIRMYLCISSSFLGLPLFILYKNSIALNRIIVANEDNTERYFKNPTYEGSSNSTSVTVPAVMYDTIPNNTPYQQVVGSGHMYESVDRNKVKGNIINLLKYQQRIFFNFMHKKINFVR